MTDFGPQGLILMIFFGKYHQAGVHKWSAHHMLGTTAVVDFFSKEENCG